MIRKTLFLFILFIFALVNSIDPNQQVINQGQLIIQSLLDKFGLSILMLMLSFSFAVLSYMVGKAINSDQIAAGGKLEIIEVIHSAILLSVIIAFFEFFNNTILLTFLNSDPAFSTICSIPSTQACHIKLSLFSLDKTYYLLLSSFIKLANIHTLTSLLSSLSVSADVVNYHMPMHSHLVFPQFSIPVEYQETAFELLIPLFFINRLFFGIIKLISTSFFNIFFAAGLSLRVFSITRKIGGFLMALAFSLYFFLPLSFILMDQIIVEVFGNVEDLDTFQINYGAFSSIYLPAELGSGHLNLTKMSNITQMEQAYENDDPGYNMKKIDLCKIKLSVTPSLNSLLDILRAILNIPLVLYEIFKSIWSFFSLGMATPYVGFNSLAHTVAKFFLIIGVLPFFNAILSIAFLKSFSSFFGGETAIGGLTHLL